MKMMKFWGQVTRNAEDGGGAAPQEEAPVVAEAPVEAPAEETPAPVEEPVVKPPQGLLDRIGQLTRQKRELEERLNQFEQQYVAPQGYAAPQGQPVASQYDPQSVHLEIHRQAQEIAKQERWRETTDKVWNEGLQKFPDWGPQLNNMAMLLGGIPQSLTEAAIESGTPHEVLYHLAKNPDEAARVAMLPPTKQAVAIASLAQNFKGGKKITSAPPAIAPKVNGAATVTASLDDPNLSMEEWAKLRMASRRKGR